MSLSNAGGSNGTAYWAVLNQIRSMPLDQKEQTPVMGSLLFEDKLPIVERIDKLAIDQCSIFCFNPAYCIYYPQIIQKSRKTQLVTKPDLIPAYRRRSTSEASFN